MRILQSIAEQQAIPGRIGVAARAVCVFKEACNLAVAGVSEIVGYIYVDAHVQDL